MSDKIKKIIKKYLGGESPSPLSLRSQLTRIIILCCVVTVCIQTVVMVAMLCRQYVREERKNVVYILESVNDKVEYMFQNIEEMALDIQHNAGLQSFFEGESYEEELVVAELKSAANLFAEWNHMESFEPIVEKIYLFNQNNQSISNLYYPMTISENHYIEKAYQALYQEFKESGKDFYVQIDDESMNLCMNLYSSKMELLGACIFGLNVNSVEANYKNLELYDYYYWSIKGEDESYLGKESFVPESHDYVLEDNMVLGSGLHSYIAISELGIYHSLWITILIVLAISFFVIIAISFIGYHMVIYYVEPLEIVAKKIELVGKGNFDTKLGEYSIVELHNISNTFNEMTDYIERLVKEVYETQLAAQQSQIKYLQSQMNPHFLFNVLSMIEMRAALNNDKEVQDMLYKLSRLYQGKIFRKNEYFIFLEEEMEIVDFYLSIQNSRFGEKITYSISYAGEVKAYQKLLVPRLSIEPIVENAVCHGLEPKGENGHICINVKVEDGMLKIYIVDDGVGFDSEIVVEKNEDRNHSHVGLWNTNKMIQNLCGNEYGLQIQSKIGEGTKVCVVLPVKGEECYVESNDCR